MKRTALPSRAIAVALAATALLVAIGCRSEEDDSEPAVMPKKVAFTGRVEPKFIGTWATADGGSKLDLAKDGGLTISTSTPSPKGVSKSSYAGSWLVEGKSLRLRYADKSGETTIEYAAALQGDKLVLQQPGGRLKTVYARK